jgi:hypothetical protein
MSTLVRVCIWVLGFFKLEAFGALVGSLELCSVDCGEIVMLLALFVDAIVNLHPMDEKMFNGVLIGK